MDETIYVFSNSELICQLGMRFKAYRKQIGYTQKKVSEQTGLSIFTISMFEKGASSGLTLNSFLKLLRSIECLDEITKLLPELPESPRMLFIKQDKNRKR